MKHNFKLKSVLATTLLVALPLLQLSQPSQAATGDRAAMQSSNAQADAQNKADKEKCGSMTGNAKDICMEEAKGKLKVARAESEFAYSGKSKDQMNVVVTKANVAYALAKEKCDDQTGNSKDVCVKEAKATQASAMADAKMNKKVSAARAESAEEKHEAAYKVAAEKCDAMTGDAKSNCMTSAKAEHAKK
jgi:hypothetical protein